MSVIPLETVNKTCGTTNPLKLLLNGGKVRRFHTGLGNFNQTVAEHSFNVALLLLMIWPDTKVEELEYALKHDLHEAFTGDMPAPTKKLPTLDRVMKELEQVYNEEYLKFRPNLDIESLKKVKVCDRMEFCIFVMDKHDMTPEVNKMLRTGLDYLIERVYDLTQSNRWLFINWFVNHNLAVRFSYFGYQVEGVLTHASK